MKMSENGKQVTKSYEGLFLRAYPDPATKNDPVKKGKPWTIGYGHTGDDVYPGLAISATRANQLFEQDIAKAEAEVNKYAHSGLTQGQFDCLVDMIYNMGSAFVKPDNINGDFDDFVASGNLPEMRKRIPQFRMANGKPMKGLIRRRASDLALWDGKSGDEAISIGQGAA